MIVHLAGIETLVDHCLSESMPSELCRGIHFVFGFPELNVGIRVKTDRSEGWPRRLAYKSYLEDTQVLNKIIKNHSKWFEFQITSRAQVRLSVLGFSTLYHIRATSAIIRTTNRPSSTNLSSLDHHQTRRTIISIQFTSYLNLLSTVLLSSNHADQMES